MVGSERKSWEGPRESMEGRNAMSASLATGHLFPGPLAPWEDGGGGGWGVGAFSHSFLKP